ncbi:DUF1304 domain-containing protein [bacterium]|nr:DUF1304 domain-containing protein [bacterium]
MRIAASVLIAIIALEHLLFLVLESFLWTRPTGLKFFRMTPEVASQTAVLAKNQGLYNGFLAAGLVWALCAPAEQTLSIRVFFLACVVVAGIVGGITAKRSILLVQGLPALVALGLVLIDR